MNQLSYYIPGTIFVLLMVYSAIIVYIGFWFFQVIFSFQLSAYVKILKYRLETEGAHDKSIYQHHQKILQFMKVYNEIGSVLMYIQIFVASLEPCGVGYTLIKAIKRNEHGAFDLLYKMILLLTGPFIICYCGQEISTQMTSLHESTYMNKWYEKKPSVRRDLYTMMLVTVRPMTLNYKLFVTLILSVSLR
ncbi:hypothetical protein O3M35_009765 [Rhynocoris fuscipes]|uniref:Uncharacterized protein n=1 Tax=Rhynocoris fuscipes TaxID=488301 RepID=A0AAW1D4W4_9HEMI